MLQIVNETPFAAGLALLCDPDGAEVVAVAVKATLAIPAAGEQPRLGAEQLEVLHADRHRGDPAATSVERPADVVLAKRGTDVGVLGSAHAPRGRPVPQVPVSVLVGRLRRVVLVVGDRRWERRALGRLAISRPEPFSVMPLTYERAFGGKDEDGNGPAIDPRNPVGTGFRVRRASAAGHPLPNLEDPAHPIARWSDRPPVAGLGFVPAWWEPRRRFAGTYDDAWRERRAPVLPADFDLRFFNAAAAGLTAPGFLRGGEPVELVNLTSSGSARFHLPRLAIRLTFAVAGRLETVDAPLWTVLLEPDRERFTMTFGGSCRVGRQPSRMRWVRVEATGEVPR